MLASILRKASYGVRLDEHLEHDCGLTVFQQKLSLGLRHLDSVHFATAHARDHGPG
jgi:hypothetical protein